MKVKATLWVVVITSAHSDYGQFDVLPAKLQFSGFTGFRYGEDEVSNSLGNHFKPNTVQPERGDLGRYKLNSFVIGKLSSANTFCSGKCWPMSSSKR